MKLAIEHAQQQKARQAEADLHKQKQKMAAACVGRSKCRVCSNQTKYRCIRCDCPVCTVCDVAEPDEDKEGWMAQRKVGYCGDCDLFGGAGDRDVEDMEEDVHDSPSISPISGKNMEIR